MISCRRVLVFGLVCSALSPAVAGEAGVGEALLRRVPDDAQLVVIVPSLARAAEGLTVFCKASDLDVGGTITSRDMIGALGVPAGWLDVEGPLVLAITAAHAEPVVIARPARASTQPAPRAVRKVAGVDVQDFDDGLLATLDDGVAIVARDEDTLRPALESRNVLGARLSKDVLARFPDRQMLLYVDVGAWRDRVDIVLNTIAQTSMMGLAAAGPDAAEAIHMQRWFFEQARVVVGEAETFAAGLRFSDQGVDYQDHISFKPDTGLAKYLASVRPVDRDPLRGLSMTKPAVVMALEWSVPPEMRTIEETMYEAILVTDERRERIGPERLKAGIERVKSAQRRLSGYNMSMQWDTKSRSMSCTGVYLTDDPNAYLEDFRAIYAEAPELFETWANFPGGCRIEHATPTVGNVKIDEFSFFISAPDSPVEAAMSAVYGENPVLSLAPHPNGVGFYLGSRDMSRAATEKSLDRSLATQRAADSRIQTALNRLAPKPQVVMLADIMRLMEFSAEMSRAMGVPGVELKGSSSDAEFVSYGLYLQADGTRQQIHVPAAAVRDVVRGIKQLNSSTTAPAE